MVLKGFSISIQFPCRSACQDVSTARGPFKHRGPIFLTSVLRDPLWQVLFLRFTNHAPSSLITCPKRRLAFTLGSWGQSASPQDVLPAKKVFVYLVMLGCRAPLNNTIQGGLQVTWDQLGPSPPQGAGDQGQHVGGQPCLHNRVSTKTPTPRLRWASLAGHTHAYCCWKQVALSRTPLGEGSW